MCENKLPEYKTSQTTLCTVMAFLIGAKEENFDYYYSANSELLTNLKTILIVVLSELYVTFAQI